MPDSAGEPWGAADDAADSIGAPVIMVPFTPRDPEEHAEQVLDCLAACRVILTGLVTVQIGRIRRAGGGICFPSASDCS